MADEPRTGHPATHDEKVWSKLIKLVLQKPSTLGYPFALWTLERVQRAFFEQEAIQLADSTVCEWVEAEGLRWKGQQSWFRDSAHLDPILWKKGGHHSGLRKPTAGRPRHLY